MSAHPFDAIAIKASLTNINGMKDTHISELQMEEAFALAWASLVERGITKGPFTAPFSEPYATVHLPSEG